MDLADLQRLFTAVYIYGSGDGGCSLGSGRRLVFWIAGDGVKTAVVTTTCEYTVLANKSFSVHSVYKAYDTKFEAGRITYRMHPDSPWVDLGPYERSGRRPGDPPLSAAREMFNTGLPYIDCSADAVDEFLLEGGEF